MIDPLKIEHIKTNVDLKAYIEKVCGSTFKKSGKGYVTRCPFPDHEDKTPSFIVTPQENLFNCFGCSRGGDIFEFDKLFFNLDFTESVKKHDSSAVKKTAVKKKISKEAMTVKEQKLLGRVVSYYHHTFTEDMSGIDYLKSRGITDNQSFQKLIRGICDLPNYYRIFCQISYQKILSIFSVSSN